MLYVIVFGLLGDVDEVFAFRESRVNDDFRA